LESLDDILKRYREAEEQSLAGYAGLKAALGDQRAQTQKAVSRIIELYESCGKPEKANPTCNQILNGR